MDREFFEKSTERVHKGLRRNVSRELTALQTTINPNNLVDGLNTLLIDAASLFMEYCNNNKEDFYKEITIDYSRRSSSRSQSFTEKLQRHVSADKPQKATLLYLLRVLKEEVEGNITQTTKEKIKTKLISNDILIDTTKKESVFNEKYNKILKIFSSVFSSLERAIFKGEVSYELTEIQKKELKNTLAPKKIIHNFYEESFFIIIRKRMQVRLSVNIYQELDNAIKSIDKIDDRDQLNALKQLKITLENYFRQSQAGKDEKEDIIFRLSEETHNFINSTINYKMMVVPQRRHNAIVYTSPSSSSDESSDAELLSKVSEEKLKIETREKPLEDSIECLSRQEEKQERTRLNLLALATVASINTLRDGQGNIKKIEKKRIEEEEKEEEKEDEQEEEIGSDTLDSQPDIQQRSSSSNILKENNNIRAVINNPNILIEEKEEALKQITKKAKAYYAECEKIIEAMPASEPKREELKKFVLAIAKGMVIAAGVGLLIVSACSGFGVSILSALLTGAAIEKMAIMLGAAALLTIGGLFGHKFLFDSFSRQTLSKTKNIAKTMQPASNSGCLRYGKITH